MLLTPFFVDFTIYGKYKLKIKGIYHDNIVIAHGKLIWCLMVYFGEETMVETWVYHVPTAGVRLLNFQSYFQN